MVVLRFLINKCKSLLNKELIFNFCCDFLIKVKLTDIIQQMKICIYLFSWWRCKKNIIASDKQLKPCIDWAYIKNLPLPPKPSFVEF